MPEYVISAVGPDRPGIVDQLTEVIEHHEANLADSRMLNLKGLFSLLMLIDVPAEQADSLRIAIDAVATKLDLQLLYRSEPEGPAHPDASGVPYTIQTYAMDQPGIVHRIAHLLARHEVNVEELDTRLEPGALSGTPLFRMHMKVVVPHVVRLRELRDELETLCDDMNCDVRIEPV